MSKYIPIIMFCIGFAGISKAEDVSLANVENVIYVAPDFVAKGETATLSICMNNTNPIRGFQFNLYLPDGITAVKNTKGKIQVSLSDERRDEDDSHTISASEQNDGSILFLCGSEYQEDFKGNEGEVATLKINVSPDVPAGSYPILLRNIKLSETDISKYYKTEQIESTIIVTESTETTEVVLDENSTTVPAAATNVDVRVKRTIKAGEWSTICLPFAMTEAQVKEAFGDDVDVELADFSGIETTLAADEAVTGIKVKFNFVSAIEANNPYIIRVSKPISEFTVEGVDITPEEMPSVDRDEKTVKVGKNTYTSYNSFIGTYVADVTVPELTLFLNGGMFWYSTGRTKMKGYRAYFDFYDVLAEVEEAGVKILVDIDGTETGVAEVSAANHQAGVYDLSGRKVAKPAQRGIYIVEGKKKLF